MAIIARGLRNVRIILDGKRQDHLAKRGAFLRLAQVLAVKFTSHARVVLHGEHHLANERQRLAIVPQVALLALRHLLELEGTLVWHGKVS